MARTARASKEVAEVQKPLDEVITEMVTDPQAASKLAIASIAGSMGGPVGNFYMPSSVDGLGQLAGIIPDKLMVPREYHAVIRQCYDFYQRGGIVSTVVNRLTELSITDITNGQRDTTDEANEYFDTILHRKPTRFARFIRTAALEYYLSGMVLPRVEWKEVYGRDLNPSLKPNKIYQVPVVDLYPPNLIKVEWAGWGEKRYLLEIPDKDIQIIRRGTANKIKSQQRKFKIWQETYPQMVQAVQNGDKYIELDVDAILRKEVSFTEYPTPFLYPVLEALIFKQQLRRMDYAVASRIINAILLVTEGSDEFPITEDNRANLDNLKAQIQMYGSNPAAGSRLFPLFSNHTTKLEWIQPDVSAMLDQSKYQEVNKEIAEGLGLSAILITGESRNAQASEVSTWAIQPMMQELQDMFLELLRPIYEEASKRNGFRKTPEPTFGPIRLQDIIKTAAVFAQAFKEGNISRTTRDAMLGVNFQSELELVKDEKELISAAGLGSLTAFPEMPYDVQSQPPNKMTGRPTTAPNSGGRPKGTQNPALTKRNVKGPTPKNAPVSKVKAEILPPEELLDLINTVMAGRGQLEIDLSDILPENDE